MLEVSAAIITDGTRVLCFQKGEAKRSYLSYKFEYPGGKLEPGETPEAALIRELGEELLMKIDESQIRRFADIVHDYDDFSVLIHYMFVLDKDPKYVLKEHILAQWVPLSEVTKLDWVGADLKASEMLEVNGIE